MTTDETDMQSQLHIAGTYYVKEITATKAGYVLSGKVHTLTVKAGQTTGICSR